MRIIYIKPNKKESFMNTSELLDKVKTLVKKVNRKTWIASGAVMIIALAILLNFLLIPPTEGTENDIPTLDIPNIEASADNNENKVVDVFAEMSLSRQQARDEAMEVLKTVTDSSTATDDVKADAMAQIETIANTIECEANIESLIMSKGFENCIAVINGDSASVIVKTDGLLQNEIAQISEIVYEQSGVLPTSLNIIESN